MGEAAATGSLVSCAHPVWDVCPHVHREHRHAGPSREHCCCTVLQARPRDVHLLIHPSDCLSLCPWLCALCTRLLALSVAQVPTLPSSSPTPPGLHCTGWALEELTDSRVSPTLSKEGSPSCVLCAAPQPLRAGRVSWDRALSQAALQEDLIPDVSAPAVGGRGRRTGSSAWLFGSSHSVLLSPRHRLGQGAGGRVPVGRALIFKNNSRV